MSQEVETLRALLLAQAHRLWSAHLIGDAPPHIAAQWDEMRRPVVGDFVAAIQVGRGVDHRQRVGVLRSIQKASIRDEPVDFILDLFDGTECRWENAQAVKLFAAPHHGGPAITPSPQTPAPSSDTLPR